MSLVACDSPKLLFCKCNVQPDMQPHFEISHMTKHLKTNISYVSEFAPNRTLDISFLVLKKERGVKKEGSYQNSCCSASDLHTQLVCPGRHVEYLFFHDTRMRWFIKSLPISVPCLPPMGMPKRLGGSKTPGNFQRNKTKQNKTKHPPAVCCSQ